MKIILLFLITLNIFAKIPYQVLESKHNKAVKLWEEGKNQEAFVIFRENKAENYHASIFYLGLYYLYGFNTVKVSYDKAFRYIDEASNAGYVDATLQKAILYYYGLGTIRDKNIAKKVLGSISQYIKLLPPKSQSYLLILNRFRFNTLKHRRKALKKMIRKFNNLDHRLIKVNQIFFYRTFRKYFKMNKINRKLLNSEVKKGNSEAQALHYEYYQDTKKSSIEILLSAGKQGDLNSQFNLYLFYKRIRDKKNKLKWLKLAAKNGDKTAKKILKYK